MNHDKHQKWARRICVSSLLLVALASSLILVKPAWSATSVDVTVNTGTIFSTNKLSLGYMLDWETQSFTSSSTLRQLSMAANFNMARLFDVRIQPCSKWNEATETGTFSWTKVDTLIKDIFAAGAQPLICFGKFSFPGSKLNMPYGMANNPATNLPYPKSYAAYCTAWVQHFQAAGLPVRYYEIINEPYFYFGWDTSETKLIGNFASVFNTVANSMRAVNPNVQISNDAFLQKKFLNYFVTYGVNLDFIDNHKYGLGESGGSDASAFSQASSLYFTSTNSICWYTFDQASQLWKSKRGKVLPEFITESNLSYQCSSCSDPRTQQMSGAVYTALVIKTAAQRGISELLYYTFASSPKALGGSRGFGMIDSDNNQPWYPYYVEKWIGTTLSVGDNLYSVTSSSSAISGFAWMHNQKLYFLLISQVNQQMTINFHGLSSSMSFSKIDTTISYLTPKVQTGVLNLSQSFAIYGYTVALFQSTP